MRFFLWWCCLSLASSSLFAYEFIRVLDPHALYPVAPHPIRSVRHYRVPCHIASANYPLIRYDFPFTREWSEARIDQWLEERYCRVSEFTIRDYRGKIWSYFSYDPNDSVGWFSPNHYRRASLAPVEFAGVAFGYIDLKGVGIQAGEMAQAHISALDAGEKSLWDIQIHGHINGGMTLGEGIWEDHWAKGAQHFLRSDVERWYKRGDLVALSTHRSEVQEIYFVAALTDARLLRGEEQVPPAIVGRQAGVRYQLVAGEAKPRWLPNIIEQFCSTDVCSNLEESLTYSPVDFGLAHWTEPAMRKLWGQEDSNDPIQSHAWAYAHQTARAIAERFSAGDTTAARAIYRAHEKTMLPFPDGPRLAYGKRQDAYWNIRKQAAFLRAMRGQTVGMLSVLTHRSASTARQMGQSNIDRAVLGYLAINESQENHWPIIIKQLDDLGWLGKGIWSYIIQRPWGPSIFGQERCALALARP